MLFCYYGNSAISTPIAILPFTIILFAYWWVWSFHWVGKYRSVYLERLARQTNLKKYLRPVLFPTVLQSGGQWQVANQFLKLAINIRTYKSFCFSFQCSYSVLSFVKVLWPEYSVWHLYAAVLHYQRNYEAIKVCHQRNKKRSQVLVSVKSSSFMNTVYLAAVTKIQYFPRYAA